MSDASKNRRIFQPGFDGCTQCEPPAQKAELQWNLPGVSAQDLRPNRARNLEIA